MATLINNLQKFRYRILNDKGHSFLYEYSNFGKILEQLKEKSNLESIELLELNNEISLLLEESSYYFYYRPYSLRCLICAYELNRYAKNENYSSEINNLIMNIHYKNNYDLLCLTSIFGEHIERLKANMHCDTILNILIKDFFYSDSGGRPRADVDEELKMNCLVVRGHQLLDWYLEKTNDVNCFLKIHNSINIFHIQKVCESLENFQIEKRSDSLNRVIANIYNSINLHLNFYMTWCTRNTESFVSDLDEMFIHILLESYDDQMFFQFLTLISKVENQKSKTLIYYYNDDDEKHIRDFVRNINI